MVEVFLYVRDLYRNLAKMLLSCDTLMESRGFVPSSNSSSTWWGDVKRLAHGKNVTDDWLPWLIARLYCRKESSSDMAAVAGVLWGDPSFNTPLAIASRMVVVDANSKHLVWICTRQACDKDAPSDGNPRIFGSDCPRYTAADRQQFDHDIKGGRILSLACPLLDIVDTEGLDRRLLDPLFSYQWPIESESSPTA
jgi:hypothetical protein